MINGLVLMFLYLTALYNFPHATYVNMLKNAKACRIKSTMCGKP